MSGGVVRVRGEGRVTVAAYGVADAEHLVEKEISRAMPEASVSVMEVRRTAERRIVEEFVVEYRIDTSVPLREQDEAEARRAAFRRARGLLAGTRYRLTRWDAVTPPGS